jgi:hypothetical protein
MPGKVFFAPDLVFPGEETFLWKLGARGAPYVETVYHGNLTSCLTVPPFSLLATTTTHQSPKQVVMAFVVTLGHDLISG